MLSELTSPGAVLTAAGLAVSLGVCVYVYFGYPGLLFVLSRARTLVRGAKS